MRFGSRLFGLAGGIAESIMVVPEVDSGVVFGGLWSCGRFRRGARAASWAYARDVNAWAAVGQFESN